MFLLVTPTVGQKVKQILCSRINILAQVAAAVRSVLTEDRVNTTAIVRTFERSIKFHQHVTISKTAEVANMFSPVTLFTLGERNGPLFIDYLNEAYEKIAFWGKIFFMLPTVNAGKKYTK